MTEQNSEQLNELIGKAIGDLNGMDPTSKDYAETRDTLIQLQKLDSEDYRIRVDDIDKAERREADIKKAEAELELKERQLEHDIRSSKIKAGIEIGGIVVPAVLYAVLFHKGLKFEETGAVTSNFVRNLLGNIKPKRR